MTMMLAGTVVLGTILAGFVQGLSGFAFGLVAMGVWVWTLDPQLAAPLVVWGSWVGQILGLRAVPAGPSWRRAFPFVIGGVLGVPVGAWLLGLVDAQAFRLCFGVLLLGYCSAMLLVGGGSRVVGGGRLADGAVGLVGGVMGGLGGFTGPAPTLWCALKGWDKDTQRGVFQAFNLSMHTVTLAVYAAKGTLTVTMLPLCALMVPVAVVPTLAGAWLYRRFSEVAFRKLVLSLLAASGAVMILSNVVR